MPTILLFFSLLFAGERGFVEDPNAVNRALIVSVSHGLSGLDIDIKNVTKMVQHAGYQFQVKMIQENDATVAKVAENLKNEASKVGDGGTLFFYFTGHGNVGIIWPQDRTMKVTEIRDAIIKGREGKEPLERLVLVYDSCHAGSMMDDMRNRAYSEAVTDSFLEAFTMRGDYEGYWKKLMVIAASRADENSLASPKGSIFTLAMKKAFDEAMSNNRTVSEFIALSQKYTSGHHPVARLVPPSLGDELMVP